VDEDVPEPATDDRPGDGPDDDEDEVIWSQAGRRHVRPDRRGEAADPARHRDPDEDDNRERERLEPDRRDVRELQDRVECEDDDSGIHDRECKGRDIDRGRPATASSRPEPTRASS